MKKSLMVMSLLLCSVFMITGCGNNTEEESGEKANYAFGVPTTESSTNYKDVMKDFMILPVRLAVKAPKLPPGAVSAR